MQKWLILREKIHAAHSLPRHEGKCRHLHGHTYDVEIALRPAFGSVMNNWKTCPTMIMDLAACRSMAKQSYGDLDHANLNDFLDEPTVEELCWKIYRDLEKHGFEVRYIRIMETDRGGVYYETERKRVE